MFVGLVVLIIGILLLFQALHLITFNVWGIFWPVIIILIGLNLMGKKSMMRWHGCCGKHHKEGEEMNK